MYAAVAEAGLLCRIGLAHPLMDEDVVQAGLLLLQIPNSALVSLQWHCRTVHDC